GEPPVASRRSAVIEQPRVAEEAVATPELISVAPKKRPAIAPPKEPEKPATASKPAERPPPTATEAEEALQALLARAGRPMEDPDQLRQDIRRFRQRFWGMPEATR